MTMNRETETGTAEENLPPLPKLSHVSALLAHAYAGARREPRQNLIFHLC